jgi:hypothetical protein
MTGHQDQINLQERLREVLGTGPATTLMSMLPRSDELATKTDIMGSGALLRSEMTEVGTSLRTEMAELRTDLRTEMADLRTELRTGMGEVRAEVASLRQEMELKYATKDDLLIVINGFNATLSGHVRTFVVVQGATVVGMSGILFGLLQLA